MPTIKAGKHGNSSSTLLNFFRKKGSDAIVTPPPASKPKCPRKRPPRKTRTTRLGRPKDRDKVRSGKIEYLGKNLKTNHVAGDLAVLPTKRKKQSGSVRIMRCAMFVCPCSFFGIIPLYTDEAESQPFNQSVYGRGWWEC